MSDSSQKSNVALESCSCDSTEASVEAYGSGAMTSGQRFIKEREKKQEDKQLVFWTRWVNDNSFTNMAAHRRTMVKGTMHTSGPIAAFFVHFLPGTQGRVTYSY